MSSPHIRPIVEKFLTNKRAGILAIRGGWGTGKTFFWRTLVKKLEENSQLEPRLYAYVSLFGISSVDQLKEAIVLSYESPLASGGTGFDGWWSNFKKNFLASNQSSLLGKFNPVSASAFFPWVRDSLICMDDLERRGGDLQIREVLGIASLLKEERNCKVVLISNSSALGVGDLDEFRRNREKLFDIDLEFFLAPRDAVTCVFTSTHPLYDEIVKNCEKLKIYNIRTIQRLERLWSGIEPLLLSCERNVLVQLMNSLVLFVWSSYEQGQGVPPIEFIKNLALPSAWAKKEKQTDEEISWLALLREYGFLVADKLDQELIRYVENGYLNADDVEKMVYELNREVVAKEGRAHFWNVCNMLRESFDNNDSQVVLNLSESLRLNISYISVNDLAFAVRVFRVLGEDALAIECIELFVSAHPTWSFDMSEHALTNGEIDPYMLHRFSEIRVKRKPVRDLAEVIRRVTSSNSWSPEDEEVLASSSADDYYAFFKNEHSADLDRYVQRCLDFGRYRDPSDRQKKIVENVKEALRKISSEGPLNRFRVSVIYGLEFDQPDGLAN